MFEGIRHRWRVRRLQKRIARLGKEWGRVRSDAQASGKSAEDIRSLEAEFRRDHDELNDEIAELQSGYLQMLAQRYFVPVPGFDVFLDGFGTKSWEQSEFTDKYRLNADARADLRKRIRAERKETWDMWYRWVPLVVGLLGALTGLVSMLKK